MNFINRFEETWTPEWDLGLQEEFGFATAKEAAAEPVLTTSRPSPWAMATREVLNRQSPVAASPSSVASSTGELVSFFEALSVEVASDE